MREASSASASLLVSIALWASCATPAPPSLRPSPPIERHGSLAEMLHDKKTAGVVSLLDVAPGPHAYALGALADLSGEVTVVDDAVWIARPRPDMTVEWTRTRRSEAQACLLVATDVAAWGERRLESPLDLAALARELPRLAREAGLDAETPFPFLVEGDLARVAFHVIDGTKLADTGDLHADHLRASRRYERERAHATVIGFFSTRDEGVFTHRGSSIHAHVVFDDTLQSGHVDELSIPAGATLKLPR